MTEVIPITKSLSPDSRGVKKGEEFMQKIEDLRKDLEVQGNSLSLMQNELTGAEARYSALQGNQNKRETESQKQALNDLYLQNEVKRQ